MKGKQPTQVAVSQDIELRLRSVETAQAVAAAVLDRMEQDLKEIALSSNAIKDVVTKWRGGLGALLLMGGALATAVSVVVELISRRLFP